MRRLCRTNCKCLEKLKVTCGDLGDTIDDYRESSSAEFGRLSVKCPSDCRRNARINIIPTKNHIINSI